MPKALLRTPQSRVWIIENGVGPANAPQYLGLGRALGITWPQGDVSPVRVPSEDAYDQFEIVDEIKGQQGLPSFSIEQRYTRDLSDMLRIVRKGCSFDVHIAMGACRNPSDFNGGFEKKLILEGGRPTSWDTGEMGALDGDQNAVVNETVPVTGRTLYEIKTLLATELAKVEITDEVIAVAICDAKSCGECGIPSSGCDVVFALTKGTSGSPGLPTELLYSKDGGATWASTSITTMGLSEVPDDMACVGTNLVVISNAGDAAHYAPIADILDGAAVWVKVTTGFVAAGSPKAIFSLDGRHTWIVGDGGYVYFTADITAGVSVQTAGSVTIQDLKAIHGIDKLNLVAVGASNAVLLTRNGGVTWSLLVGPAAGIVLQAVWMRAADEWLVGAANGRLYYTREAADAGSWVEKAFPGSGAGQVRDIQFATPTIGYMAHDSAAPVGRILRTLDGGFSWYVLPESTATMPDNDRINSLAACPDDPNVVFGGGLGGNGTDGFLVKAA